MYYKLPSKQSGYCPTAMAVLEALRGMSLSNFERGYRHPIDIFITSIRDFLRNLDDLLDFVEIGRKDQLYLAGNKPNEWEKGLIRQLDHTFDSTVQFVDACRSIILCCFETTQEKQSTKAVRRFNTTVRPYTDRVATIVNSIKHSQRTLNLLYFHDIGVFIPGFYVEGVLGPDIVGPDPKVHPGSNTAISLYREIPALVCTSYFVSSVMANEVCTTAHVKPSANFKPPVDLEDLIMSIMRKTSLLPLEFFTDEVSKPLPLIRYVEKSGINKPQVEIEMPSTRFKARTPKSCRIDASWTTSSVAHTIKVPYMGKDYVAPAI